jgi:hypothetical protein
VNSSIAKLPEQGHNTPRHLIIWSSAMLRAAILVVMLSFSLGAVATPFHYVSAELAFWMLSILLLRIT